MRDTPSSHQSHGLVHEQIVLGCALMKPSLLATTKLVAEDFTDPVHRSAFSHMMSFAAKHVEFDILVLTPPIAHATGREDREVARYLNDLIMQVPSIASFDAHEQCVLVGAHRRHFRDQLIAGQGTASLAELLTQARAACAAIEQRLGKGAAEKVTYVSAHAVSAESLAESSEELVDGLLHKGSLAALYGGSNVGKSFLAVDLCCSVVRASDWMGRRTAGGLVIYVAAESPGSILRRVAAYKSKHSVDLDGLVVVNSCIDLYGSPDSARDMVQFARHIEELFGRKVELIVFDTLAHSIGAADENNGAAMNHVIHVLDAIRAGAKSAVLLVHHSGKDASKGMRGWSGLRAALDTEVAVVSDKRGVKRATVTKQREYESLPNPICFELERIALGVNTSGREWGSCVVRGCEGDVQLAQAPGGAGVHESILVYLRSAGDDVRRQQLVTHCVQDLKRSRSTAYGAIKDLHKRKLIVVEGTKVRVA